MKIFIHSIIAVVIFSFANPGFSQTVNWRSLENSDNHIVNLNAGWDYATTFGIGYGHKLNTQIPLIIGMEFSLPAGDQMFDDLKTKVGAQAEVFRSGNFSASVKFQGIFRRYESDFVRLANFGSEISTALGYYRSTWYAAAEFGFDKSIITHIKHGSVMEEYYPEIKSGWYIPTGGNFFYGIQGGYSFKEADLYLKAGKTVTQDFKTTATVPYYLQLGINKRF
ncbi:MAG TPA: hypothetical protein VFO54_02735 [Chryseosolibacter sp.]|nr:hypothetical protein [Chryseosolibacter sp.]